MLKNVSKIVRSQFDFSQRCGTLPRDEMYKNDEMYNLMQALQVEDTTESLRYEKVILATDADVDGSLVVPVEE